MLKKLIIGAGALLLASLGMMRAATAAIINAEFNFTPFVGDVGQAEVETVPGKARVFINTIPVNEIDVMQGKVSVLFEAREIAPAVWINALSLGSLVKRGENRLRIEFAPTDPGVAYQARFQWNQVSDQVTQAQTPNGTSSTNRAAQGMETRPAKGSVVIENTFQGDFAADRPWHHYPAISAISEQDRQQLLSHLKARAKLFKPKFAGIYPILAKTPQLKVADIRKAKCLDLAYAAGVRVRLAHDADIDIATTGGPAVVVSNRNGPLYLGDEKPFSRMKDEEVAFCAAVALSVAYPQRAVLVKTPAGQWAQID